MNFKLEITPCLRNMFPGYTMMILYVSGIKKNLTFDTLSILRNSEQELRNKLTTDTLLEDANIKGWRETYRTFGVKPRSAVCAVEALAKRVLKGHGLPDINPVVNIYNALSLKYLIPIGGEDRDALTSDLIFKVADGNEPFITGHNAQEISYPKQGEIIWADSSGVTCRRWNWRQCTRTKVTHDTKNAYFVLDCLPSYKKEDLDKVKNELISLLTELLVEIQVTEEFVEL